MTTIDASTSTMIRPVPARAGAGRPSMGHRAQSSPADLLVAHTDSLLLNRVASQEPGSVQEFLDTYGGLIWSLARRFSDNAADAEDAVQEILVNIWQHAGRYDPEVAKEATFIAMIARRRLIDRRRKRQRRPDGATVSAEILELASDRAPRSTPDDDESARALDALSQLRPEQQKVLRLAIGQGCTYEQVSEVTGIPLGTVKTHARRGLIRVREILGLNESSPSSARR